MAAMRLTKAELFFSGARGRLRKTAPGVRVGEGWMPISNQLSPIMKDAPGRREEVRAVLR